ncbi:hypothetical protein V6N11_042474 [Hibiscus sabdariffa]|uniref:Transmembrane protein n=1 Tax=Hibiscus sabdariffa TaxID=183260 RepID=A0ABR2QWF4_9ROSI
MSQFQPPAWNWKVVLKEEIKSTLGRIHRGMLEGTVVLPENGGSGCLLWFTDLIDMRYITNSGQVIYAKVAASELSQNGSTRHRAKASNRTSIIATTSALSAGVLIAVLTVVLFLRSKKNLKGKAIISFSIQYQKAWRWFCDGNSMELVADTMKRTCNPSEVQRSIQPKQTGFFNEIDLIKDTSSSSEVQKPACSNDLTITVGKMMQISCNCCVFFSSILLDMMVVNVILSRSVSKCSATHKKFYRGSNAVMVDWSSDSCLPTADLA